MGHIGFGLSVRACVCPFPVYSQERLKIGSCILKYME